MPGTIQPAGDMFVFPEARGAVLRRRLAHTFRYWMETEVHVYGFSIAANVLLSFFPFLIVMVSVCHEILGWRTAADAINLMIRDYFPDQLGLFISNYLPHRTLQIVSVLLLLFTANGVFEPLEVALNRAWGITRNRSYVRNQMVSLALIFTCGTLALCSSLLTGMNMRQLGGDAVSRVMVLVFFKMAAIPMSILMLFLIYWLLPNAKISPRFVLPPAIFVGLALELLKYVNLLTWPMWRRKLHAEYGPFYYSVTIVLWSFLAAMVILAGAEWAAQAAAEHRSRGTASATTTQA
jgi:membrane protein